MRFTAILQKRKTLGDRAKNAFIQLMENMNITQIVILVINFIQIIGLELQAKLGEWLQTLPAHSRALLPLLTQGQDTCFKTCEHLKSLCTE